MYFTFEEPNGFELHIAVASLSLGKRKRSLIEMSLSWRYVFTKRPTEWFWHLLDKWKIRRMTTKGDLHDSSALCRPSWFSPSSFFHSHRSRHRTLRVVRSMNFSREEFSSSKRSYCSGVTSHLALYSMVEGDPWRLWWYHFYRPHFFLVRMPPSLKTRFEP